MQPDLRKFQELQHFRFAESEPGCVFIKQCSDSDAELKVELLKSAWSPDLSDLPAIITPKGLSATRQWYLHDSIRQFCSDEDKDITCPLPNVPKPISRENSPAPEISHPTESSVTASPPPKKRRCGLCRQEGHNSRSCPNKN